MKKLILFILLTASILFAKDITPLEIGASAPDFSLIGIDSVSYSLDDFDQFDNLVIVFTATHCPTAQAYEKRLIQLVNDYKPKNVGFVAISPNAPQAVCLEELGYTDLDDSFEHMKLRAQQIGLNMPFLYDGDSQDMAKAYGPAATPHVFVFDKQRTLRYQGRVDDTESPHETPKQYDLRNALDALIDGKSVPVEKTKTLGCSIKWASKVDWKQQVQKEWESRDVSVNPIDLNGIKKLLQNDTDNYVLINVWATWCGPCVIEFPELVNTYRMYQNRRFDMISISVDKPTATAKVLNFLQKKHAAFTNYHYNSTDVETLINTVDPDWQGAIPYTIILEPGGKVFYKHMGIIDPIEVRREIVNKLGRFFADD